MNSLIHSIPYYCSTLTCILVIIVYGTNQYKQYQHTLHSHKIQPLELYLNSSTMSELSPCYYTFSYNTVYSYPYPLVQESYHQVYITYKLDWTSNENIFHLYLLVPFLAIYCNLTYLQQRSSDGENILFQLYGFDRGELDNIELDSLQHKQVYVPLNDMVHTDVSTLQHHITDNLFHGVYNTHDTAVILQIGPSTIHSYNPVYCDRKLHNKLKQKYCAKQVHSPIRYDIFDYHNNNTIHIVYDCSHQCYNHNFNVQLNKIHIALLHIFNGHNIELYIVSSTMVSTQPLDVPPTIYYHNMVYQSTVHQLQMMIYSDILIQANNAISHTASILNNGVSIVIIQSDSNEHIDYTCHDTVLYDPSTGILSDPSILFDSTEFYIKHRIQYTDYAQCDAIV